MDKAEARLALLKNKTAKAAQASAALRREVIFMIG
jgi:hypothetical protein